MQLLLPKLDKSRIAFGIAETRVADLYIVALGMAKTSASAVSLKAWNQSEVRDFADFVGVALGPRLASEGGKYTIYQVNAMLDRLEQGDKQEIFREIATQLSLQEQKWLIRVVLKDLKLGISDQQILKALNPEAPDFYAVCSDLKILCDELAELKPGEKLSRPVTLFSQVASMLAFREAPAKLSASVRKEPSLFVADAKIDGERMQLHCDRNIFRYLSRNGTDFTHLYGASSAHGPLSDKLIPVFDSSMKTTIFDGEMVLLDTDLNKLVPFGSLRSTLWPANQHPLFIAFDLLYLNGESLLSQPLDARRQLLKSTIRGDSEYIRVVDDWSPSASLPLSGILETALSQGYEGLVIKKRNSIYVPGQRTPEWTKLKADYIEAICDDIDLLVIGADLGRSVSNAPAGICTLLCGTFDKDGKLLPVARIGSGFNFKELSHIRQILSPSLKPFSRMASYEFEVPRSLEPDFVVEDSKKTGLVIQVRATNIIPSDVYAAGYTLRFPRFIRCRPDKDASSLTSLGEIIELKDKSPNVTDLGSIPESKVKRMKTLKKVVGKKLAEALGSLPARSSSPTLEGRSFLNDLEFCILYGDETHTKGALESLVRSNGGRITQNPTAFTYAVISSKENGLRIENIKKAGIVDILPVSYLIRCFEQGRILGKGECDSIFLTRRTVLALQMEKNVPEKEHEESSASDEDQSTTTDDDIPEKDF